MVPLYGFVLRNGVVRRALSAVKRRGSPTFAALVATAFAATTIVAPATGATTRVVPSVVGGALAGDTRIGVNVDDIAPGRGGGIVFVDAMKQAPPWTSAAPFVRDVAGNVAMLRAGALAKLRERCAATAAGTHCSGIASARRSVPRYAR